MVFVPADASNIVPNSRLVAAITLIHLSSGLLRHTGRNHREVHHEVARRSLMALHTVLRVWRRMAIFRNSPFRHAMTRRTVAPKEAPVTILYGMTVRTVQCRLNGRNIWVAAEQSLLIHVLAYLAALRVGSVCLFQL